MDTLTVKDLHQLVSANNTSALGEHHYRLILDDDEIVNLPGRTLILHSIIWEPLRYFGLPVTKDQIYNLYPFSTTTLAKAQTVQYQYILDHVDVHYMKIIEQLFNTVHKVYCFGFVNVGAFQESIDLIDLIDMYYAEELKDLLHEPIDVSQGTSYAEKDYGEKSRELIRRISTHGEIINNPLETLVINGTFNSGQLPQLLLAMGARSDINDRMLPHVITNSCLEGMNSMKDVGTELTASKKTTHFNSTIISDTQSFNREMGLYTCNLIHRYDGDCGRRLPIDHFISKQYTHNYIDKVVVVNDELKTITSDNHSSFGDMRVGLVSPIACNHEDGVCAHCMGRPTKHPWSFMPEVRIGGYASAFTFSILTQRVLNAKHLIRTSTIKIDLSELAELYFSETKQNILKFNKSKIAPLASKYMCVPIDGLGHLSDLEYDGITEEGFGLVSQVAIEDKSTGVIDKFDLSDNNTLQHFSTAFLQHIRNNINNIEIEEGWYKIPLKGFNFNRIVFHVVELNADMVAYAKQVRGLFKSGLAEYSTASVALQRITNIIYSKLDINIVFLELVVKAILNGVLPDDGKISINKLGTGIGKNNIAAKIGHGDVAKYLYSPEVSVVPKKPSVFDPLFGFKF